MRRGWGVVAMVLVAVIGGWVFYASSPTTGPTPVWTPEPVAAEAPKVAASPEAPVGVENVEETVPAAAPRPVLGGPGASRIPPSTRAFESPAAASAFVEDHFLELLGMIAPEIDPKEITRTCEEDGRICTFDGPWPGNELLKNWIRAVSDGRTGPEQLDGVMFSEFSAVDVDGEKRLRVVAHAP